MKVRFFVGLGLSTFAFSIVASSISNVPLALSLLIVAVASIGLAMKFEE